MATEPRDRSAPRKRRAGRTSDFRDIDGLLVPHMMVAAWVIDGKETEYVRFSVDGNSA